MQKLKKNKRLTLAVIAFMLTFVVGAAFAATPGGLQAVGTIGVGEPDLSVIWTTVTPGANDAIAVRQATIAAGANIATPAGQPDQVAQRPTHLAAQRVDWQIGFIDDGTVTLTAVATNDGNVTARVHAPGLAPNPPMPAAGLGALAWLDPDPAVVAPFTVGAPTITATSIAIPPALTFPFDLPVGDTITVQFTIAWNGDLAPFTGPGGGIGAHTFPPTFGPGSPFHTGGFLEDFDWGNSFVMSLPYTLVP